MPQTALRALPKMKALLFQYASEGKARARGRYDNALRELAEEVSASELPVFRRLADLLTVLADSGSSCTLLEAAAMTGLADAALARTTSVPETKPFIPAQVRVNRRTPSYRDLMTAREALSGRGVNRIETLRRFYEDNGADYRLAPRLADALCDPEPEIRLLCRQWLLELGPAAAALTANGMDIIRANALDARKASLTACLLGREGLAFCLDGFRRGGKAVRGAVLEALTEFGGEEGFQVAAGALYDTERTVREAAFRALSRYGGEKAVAPLEKAVSADCRAALFALSALRHPSAERALLRLGNVFATEGVRKLEWVAEALGRREEKTRQAFDFLCAQLERLRTGAFLEDTGVSLEIVLTQALASWNTLEALEVLERFLPKAQMPAIIAEAALRLRSPEDFYERYGSTGKLSQAVRSLLRNLLTCGEPLVLDTRWNEAFCSEGDGMMAALTAEPGMNHAERFLRRFRYCGELSPAENLHLLFCVYPQALLRVGADGFWPELLDALASLLDKYPPESDFPWKRLYARPLAETFALGGPDTAERLHRMAGEYRHEALKELSFICDKVYEGWMAWKS